MMSFPIWLSGPMFLLEGGVSVQGDFCLGGLCPGGGGVSVRKTPHLYGEERVVRILLECFLVLSGIIHSHRFMTDIENSFMYINITNTVHLHKIPVYTSPETISVM